MDAETLKVVIDALRNKGMYNEKPDFTNRDEILRQRHAYLAIFNVFLVIFDAVFLVFLVVNEYPREIIIESIIVENLLLTFLLLKTFSEDTDPQRAIAVIEFCIFVVTLVMAAFYAVSIFNSIIALFSAILTFNMANISTVVKKQL
jgi:hypothetical protein